MMLGIVSASPYEAKSITGTRAVMGKLYSVEDKAFLLVSGAGRDNASAAAEYLLNKGIGALMSWGFVGALRPGLSAGDVVLAETLIEDGNELKVNRSWRTAMRKRLAEFTRIYDGNLIHSDKPIDSPDDRRLLHDSSSAIAVDMESFAVAQIAHRAKLPFLSLKVVAGSATTRTPSVLSSKMQQTGDLNLSQILAGVGPRPWQWPATVKLTHGSRLALDKLRLIADRLELNFAPAAPKSRKRVTKPS